MFEKSFSLEIIAPDKVVYRDAASSVSVPGVLGGFQVLYDHAPLLSALEIGQIKVREKSGSELSYATGGGFVEVLKNRVVVLVESAEPAGEIDVPRAQAARARAEERLRLRGAGVDLARARLARLRAINRLRLAVKK